MKRVILKNTRYPKLNIINPELMLNLDEYYEEIEQQEDNEVYVFAGFMKPGRQCYAIAVPDKDEDGEDELRYFTHKSVIPYR